VFRIWRYCHVTPPSIVHIVRVSILPRPRDLSDANAVPRPYLSVSQVHGSNQCSTARSFPRLPLRHPYKLELLSWRRTGSGCTLLWLLMEQIDRKDVLRIKSTSLTNYENSRWWLPIKGDGLEGGRDWRHPFRQGELQCQDPSEGASRMEEDVRAQDCFEEEAQPEPGDPVQAGDIELRESQHGVNLRSTLHHAERLYCVEAPSCTRMSFVIQTQVMLPNRPGELEKLSRAIAEAGVNMHAIMMREDVGGSTVRIVLDKPKVARDALVKHNLAVTESKLVAVLVTDQPGEFWKVSAALAAHGANIQYSYTAAKPVHGKVALLIAIGGVPPERAVGILQKEGFECVDHATLVSAASNSKS